MWKEAVVAYRHFTAKKLGKPWQLHSRLRAAICTRNPYHKSDSVLSATEPRHVLKVCQKLAFPDMAKLQWLEGWRINSQE